MASLKKIIPNTIKIGFYALMSRFLGIAREIFMARYLGAGTISDAFLTAFKIPNSLRKIFAEGALSAVFVPALTQRITVHNKPSSIFGLMSLSLLAIETIVLVLCVIIMIFSLPITSFMAPGFSSAQKEMAAQFLFIMMPFIFFLSSSALLGGALQSIHQFWIPACGPVLLNISFLISLILLIFFNLPVIYFCYCILIAGGIQLAFCLYGYCKAGFRLGLPAHEDIKDFVPLFMRFIPTLISMSLTEINMITSNILASYLPPGSWTVIYYALRFRGIPESIFAVSLSTVLLPYFSHITTYAPRRMSYLILETTKLILWLTTIATGIMIFLSHKIFITLFLSSKFTLVHAHQAATSLSLYACGLFFFSFHKIILNVYYSFKITWFPATTTLCAVCVNSLCSFLLAPYAGIYGIVASNLISVVVHTTILTLALPFFIPLTLPVYRFMRVSIRIIIHACFLFILFIILYHGIEKLLLYIPSRYYYLLTETFYFWCWCIPLIIIVMIISCKTRHQFGISLSLLDYH